MRAKAALGCLWSVAVIVRVYLCLQTPFYTTDLLRNLLCGKAFWAYGMEVYRAPVSDYTEEMLAPQLGYYYPWAPLLFFAVTAGLNLGLVWNKLLLTGMEFAAALLMNRISRKRWVGLLYFLSPASMLWVSQEGQFEPVMIVLMALSLVYLAQQRTTLAGACLSFAIQAKVFAVFLAPQFLYAWLKNRRLLALVALTFLPSLVLALMTPYLSPHLTAAGHPDFIRIHRWDALWHKPFTVEALNVAARLESSCLVALLIAGIVLLRRKWLMLLPPCLFIVALLSGIGAGGWWYLLVLPAFYIPALGERAGRALFAAAVLVPVTAPWLLFFPDLHVLAVDPPAVFTNRQFRFGLKEEVPYFFHLGRKLTTEEENRGFIRAYQPAAFDPRFAFYSHLRMRLGVSHLMVGEVDPGLKFMGDGVRLEPSNDRVWQMLVEAALKLDRREVAEAAVAEWLSHRPGNPVALSLQQQIAKLPAGGSTPRSEP